MTKWVLITVLSLGFAAVAGAQQPSDTVDAERFRAAQERLAAKAKERDAARDQKVEITKGELDDMRAKIASLEAEVRALRGGPATAPAAAKGKIRNGIEPGMTREELERFVKSKLGALRVNVESVTMREGHRVEVLSVAKIGKVAKAVGTKTDFLGGNHTVYASGEEIQAAARVVLEDGVVTEVTGR